jgi:class 3 adenylate cyclase
MSSPDVDSPEFKENSQRATAIYFITVASLMVSVLYVALHALTGAKQLVLFNVVFVLIYGTLARRQRSDQLRVTGILLIASGTAQLTGTALLFIYPDAGSHTFLMLVPIFSLIAIEPRDRFWWLLLSSIAISTIVGLEFARNSYVPILAIESVEAYHAPYRALAAFLTVVLSFVVFLNFHRDLHLARKEIGSAYERSEFLLQNMLPKSIAQRLKKTTTTIADDYEEASVLFADLVGFTEMTASQPAHETIELLNEIFSAFDQAVAARGLEKIKTIGDCYMVAAGVPIPQKDHADQLLEFAKEMLEILREHNLRTGRKLSLRIGLNTGPVVAGVIGSRKYTYDIWGDTVNVASRMESTGVPGRIQVTEAVAKAASDQFQFEERGLIEVKGKGEIRTFFLPESPPN